MKKEPLQEQELVYSVPVDVAMYDGHGAFFPSAYQQMVTGVIQKHLEAIEMDVPRLMKKYGVSWVLLSLSLELKRPFRRTEQLTARTWHTSGHLPIYRREIAFYDDQQEIVAVGTTFSTILDLKTRRICSDRELMEQFQMPEGETLLKASSRFSSKAEFTEVEHRIARSSWQDGLGHVNNARYGELVYDALTPSEQLALRELKRLDVWFLAELKPGDEVSVQRAEKEGSIVIKGEILPEGKPSFAMKLTF